MADAYSDSEDDDMLQLSNEIREDEDSQLADRLPEDWVPHYLRTDFDHARYGSWFNIQDLIESGFDINQRDHNGRTLLHLAVIGNDTTRVITLLSLNADPSVLDNDGNSPLQVVGQSRSEFNIRHHLSEAIEERHRQAVAAAEALEKERQIRSEAFVMGLHARLGNNSRVFEQQEDMVRAILAVLESSGGSV
jgi:ankyrin repeat protein